MKSKKRILFITVPIFLITTLLFSFYYSSLEIVPVKVDLSDDYFSKTKVTYDKYKNKTKIILYRKNTRRIYATPKMKNGNLYLYIHTSLLHGEVSKIELIHEGKVKKVIITDKGVLDLG